MIKNKQGDVCMRKRIIGMALVLVMALSTSAPFAWALPQRTTLEYEKEVYEFIHDNVLPEHAMGLDYRNISKADAKELQDIVDSVTEGCTTVRDKAYEIYLCISQNVEYNYEELETAAVTHCKERDCPILDISNTSGVSVAMAHHVYKYGFGICEDYANLSSVMMVHMRSMLFMTEADGYFLMPHGQTKEILKIILI